MDVTEYGVRGKRGDFEPLVSEDTFYRVQAVLTGRTPSLAPQLQGTRIRLRGFVRREFCRGLTRSWPEVRMLESLH